MKKLIIIPDIKYRYGSLGDRFPTTDTSDKLKTTKRKIIAPWIYGIWYTHPLKSRILFRVKGVSFGSKQTNQQHGFTLKFIYAIEKEFLWWNHQKWILFLTLYYSPSPS